MTSSYFELRRPGSSYRSRERAGQQHYNQAPAIQPIYRNQQAQTQEFYNQVYNTGKNLHSHDEYKSPLSKRQEVSGFGDEGSGDAGDDWEIVCNDMTSLGPVQKQPGQTIYGDTLFFLKHTDTAKFLISDNDTKYTN